MKINLFSKITFAIVIVFLLFGSFLFLVLQQIKYDWLISYILFQINRPDLFETITQQYFTEEKFILIKKVSCIFSFCNAVFFVICLVFRKNIIVFIEKFLIRLNTFIRTYFKLLTSNEKKISIGLICLLLFVIIRSLYYALSFDIQHDEAWNYNYFLHKNIFFTAFAYNNYPLHNIITWFFVNAFGSSVLSIRLSVILMGLFCCSSLFVIIKSIFKSEQIALCTSAIFACLPISVFYMMYARGVMFEIFFSLFIFYFMYRYLNEKWRIEKILLVSILNALGTYSMLSHIYFIGFSSLAFLCFILIKRQNDLKFLLFYFTFSILFSCILLLPMYFGTGLSLGLDAGLSGQNFLALHLLPYHCYSDFITGSWIVFYILFFINIIFLFSKKYTEYIFIFILNIVLLVSPFIIKILTHSFPPERALAFLIIVPISSIACLFLFFQNNKSMMYIITVVLIIILSIRVHTHSYFNWSKMLDKEAKNLSNILIKNDIKHIYSFSDYFNYYTPAITYYYNQKNKTLNISSNNKKSKRYNTKIENDVDCMISDSTLIDGELIFFAEKMKVYKMK